MDGALAMIFLDTHIVVWLYSGYFEKLSEKAKQLMEVEELLISPMVILELQYLFEINRIKVASLEIYEDLHFNIGLRLDETPWSCIIKQSLSINYTRDPFDRLIIAHAQVSKSKLITKDENILSQYNQALW